MKILIVARGYVGKKSNIGIFERDQAIMLKKMGHDVRVVAGDFSSIKHWRKFGYIKNNDEFLSVVSSFQLRILPCFIRKHLCRFYLYNCYKRISSDGWKPDIIHAHFGDVGNQAIKIKKKLSVPLVITEHYSGFLDKKHCISEIVTLSLEAYKYADVLICVSESLKNVLEEKTKRHFIIVPNVLDPICFSAKKPISHNDADIIKICSCGSLISRKGFDKLILCLSSLHLKYELTIFGEGPDRNKLQKLINDLRLGNSVFLRGNCSRNQMVDQYLKSDCFVLFSSFETFGVSFIEALACGLPVFSLNCGGTNEFIDDSNGIICDENGVNEISLVLEKFLLNQKKYDRRLIQSSIFDKYDFESIGTQLTKLYLTCKK